MMVFVPLWIAFLAVIWGALAVIWLVRLLTSRRNVCKVGKPE